MIQSAEEFVRLRCSDNREEYTRAAHEPAPEDVWIDVIDRYPDMRVWVVRNKTVPVSILRILLGDPDWRVRHALAQTRRLTAEMFAELAQDPDETVRRAIVGNKKAPREVLQTLASDAITLVAEAAKDRLRKQK